MFSRLYQAELAVLRERGREFAAAHPEAARHLGTPGTDPDVERLLAGTAFLAARIRQHLDAGLPDLTHDLLAAFMPQAVRPLPAMTLVRFTPGPQQRETLVLPAGTALDAVPLAGTVCRFRTVHDLAIAPLTIAAVSVEPGPPPRIRLDFRIPPGVHLTHLTLERVRLHLAGDLAAARDLHLSLARHDGVAVVIDERRLNLPLHLECTGTAPAEALLPGGPGDHDGQRLLGEWLAFPQRFLALDLCGLDRLVLPPGTTTFRIEVICARHARSLPAPTAESIVLHTVPAVNLFPAEMEPIIHDGSRSRHRVVPASGLGNQIGIYALTALHGRVRGHPGAISFRPHLHGRRDPTCGTWRERRVPGLADAGSEVEIELEPPADCTGPLILSGDLLATNRDLPRQLVPGELRVPTRDVPPGLSFRNLAVPTALGEPDLAGDGPWQLVAQLTADHETLASAAGLRRLLHLVARDGAEAGGRPLAQRAADSVRAVHQRPSLRHHGGAPIRGVAITIELAEDVLGGLGDAHLFATILDAVYAETVTLNAFTQLTVRCSRAGLEFAFPARLGQRRLL
jgi:type VI secretion system protein ImpG